MSSPSGLAASGAAILADWMNGTSIQEIEGKFSMPFGGQVQSGDINRFADATRFHLRSAHQILSALLSMSAEQEIEFEKVERQLEFGVPHDLVAFMQAPLLLSRGEALALANAGMRSRQALGKMDDAGLRAVLGKDRASALQAALKAHPDQTVVAA